MTEQIIKGDARAIKNGVVSIVEQWYESFKTSIGLEDVHTKLIELGHVIELQNAKELLDGLINDGKILQDGEIFFYKPLELVDQDSIEELAELKTRPEQIGHVVGYVLGKNKVITLDDTEEILRYNNGIYINAEPKIKTIIQMFFGEDGTNNLTKEILGQIQRSTYTAREVFAHTPLELLCLENGLLNVETKELLDFTPNHYFRSKLPVRYAASANCPKFKEFLSQCVDTEDILLLQEFVGYCLWREYNHNKSIMLVGTGSNGKSTFLNVLKKLFGSHNTTSLSLQTLETNRFALAQLEGKMVNLFADLSSKALYSTGTFKMLTGGDPIYAEKKFKDGYTLTNYAKLIFSANRLPRSPDDSDAFMRRWFIVNWPNQFLNEQADKGLLAKLTSSQELSGILNWALEGLQRLLKNQEFSQRTNIAKAREEYLRMSDSVAAFFIDELEVDSDESLIKDVLYANYTDYCRKMKYPIESKHKFTKLLHNQAKLSEHRLSTEGRPIAIKGVKFKQTEVIENTQGELNKYA